MEPSKVFNVNCTNILDADEDQLLAKLCTKFAGSRNEIAKLQARVLALELENLGLQCDVSTISELKRENSTLKSENADLQLFLKQKEVDLKDSQSLLGQYVLTASRQGHTNSFAEPTRRLEPLLKRARSRSLELLECTQPPSKKSKESSGGPSLEPETVSRLQSLSPSEKAVYSSLSDLKCRNIKLEANENPTPRAEVVKDIVAREVGEGPLNCAVSSNTISSTSLLPESPRQTHPPAIPLLNEDNARANPAITDILSKQVLPTTRCSTIFSTSSTASKSPMQALEQSNPLQKPDDRANADLKDVSSLHNEPALVATASFSPSTSTSSPTPENAKHTSVKINSTHHEDQARLNTATQSILTLPASQPAHAQSDSTSQEDNARVTDTVKGVFTLLNGGQVIIAAASLSSPSMLENLKQASPQPNTATGKGKAPASPIAQDALILPNESPGNLVTAPSTITSTSSLVFETPKQGSAPSNSASEEDKVRKTRISSSIKDLFTISNRGPPITAASFSSIRCTSGSERPTSAQTPSTHLSGMTEFYLKSAQALTITPPPLDLDVPRAFLRLTYGGSDQHWLQFIAASRNPCGPDQRRIVFPKQELNPAMPTAPGEPGLIFASRHEILSNPPWMVFRKHSKAPALWRYLGEYECVLCGTMTGEQFKNLAPGVKRERAKALLTTKAFEVYVAMRARIALRIAGTIPVEDKDEEKKLVEAEIEAVKRGEGQPVTEVDIEAALSNGDEGIDIIRMTCVKYDHVFANHMKGKLSDPQVKRRVKKTGGTPKAQPEDTYVSSDVDMVGHSDEEYIAPPHADAGTSVSISTAPGPQLRRSGRNSSVNG